MTTSAQAASAPDDFDAAFAQFSVPEGGTPASAASAATTDEGGSPAATEGGTDDTGGTGAAVVEPGSTDDTGGSGTGAAAADDKGTAKVAEPAAAPAAGDGAGEAGKPARDAGTTTSAAPAAAAPVDADAILDKLGQLVEAASTKPAEAKTETSAAQPESPYTPEQAAELVQYEKDWPDVAKFEGMRRQGEYKQLLDFVFSEVRKYVDPLRDTLDSLAGRTHLSDVRAAVTDYSDNLRQQVIDWVKTQPAYLQTAYEHVITEGTVDEVKDLVDRYRQATGQVAPPGSGTGQKTGGTNELSGEAKKAAEALAPVESKRSEVVGSGDPTSFDDGWAQFAKDFG